MSVCVSVSCSCLEHLLDNGADPSVRNVKGYTAVHYAAAYGNKRNLELVSAACAPRLLRLTCEIWASPRITHSLPALWGPLLLTS